jgi:[glutamine synthetase] adenylyltransferase / [glutamine synthetase]-adenylyl-L-tyrosine phosphorylase
MIARMKPECLPVKLHAVVERWFERAQDYPETVQACTRLNEEQHGQLVRTVALSEFAANVLLRDPGLIADLASASPGAAPGESLRIWRRREMTRVVWRDVNALSSVPQTLRTLSDLADTAIRSAATAAVRELAPTFGVARSASGAEVSFIVLGMGKLGGHELNFSSDVDLVFLYSEGGETSGPRVIDNGEYFNRLGGTVIRMLDQNTEHGFVFRVDMRLRPFGQSGPLVISLGALEDYLQQHGRDWERYAWIKARPITAAAAYADTYRDCVRPFVYRRYLDFGVFESLRDMKALIAREVSRRDLAQHLKLGTGGIREIEFIAQSFQLVRGGSDPRLQNASILEVLPLLAGSKLLREAVVAELANAYFVLRKAENAVQMIRDEQTHSLPEEEVDRARVALALGTGDWEAALARIDAARNTVAQHFDSLVFGAADARRARADEEMAWFASDRGRTRQSRFSAGGSRADCDSSGILSARRTLPPPRRNGPAPRAAAVEPSARSDRRLQRSVHGDRTRAAGAGGDRRPVLLSCAVERAAARVRPVDRRVRDQRLSRAADSRISTAAG